MSRQKRLFWSIIIGGVLLLLSPYPSRFHVSAQDGDDDACDTLLTEALQVVGSACAEMGQNEACYGHFPVTTELQADSSGQFETDGDLIEIPQLQTLITEPANPDTGEWGIALLLVEADSPESSDTTMTFVLFGDVTLNSQGTVASDSATCNITNSGNQNINLRSGPSTTDDIVGTFEIDDTTTVVGRDETTDWLHIQQDDTSAWIYAPLIATDCDLSTLETLDSSGTRLSPRSTSTFSLETGQSDTCNALPNGLMVRSPEGRRARVIINGVELAFSSVGYLTAQADQHMSLSVLDGQVEATADGQTEIVTPNMSSTIPLSGLTASGPPTSPQSQTEPETIIVPALNDATVMLDENEIGNPACAVLASATVNLRGGPGTNYGLGGQLEADSEATVSGTATGADGAVWWQLDGGNWVRSDLVTTSGRCEDIPNVVPPTPPPTAQPTAPPVSGRRMVAIDPYSDTVVPLLPIEMGCFQGSAPITPVPAGTLGYVTGDPQCNRYPVTFDTGEVGWLLDIYVQFLE